MTFIDQAKIYVKAGNGGAGCVSFRREKYVPRGGPDGGDGGDGGSIFLQVDSGLNTLLHFQRNKQFLAEQGRAGRNKNQHGKKGTDIIIKVPPGTLVKDAETGMELADLIDINSDMWLAVKGGMGGRGNARFSSSTNQAPVYAQQGTSGEERNLLLELKLVADVGLVGMPNAGKSTFLARISAAKPKIADYPFTTLKPYLGVASLSDERTLVVADIPGLIKGAHKGSGMGLDFLRHIERCKVLLHIIDISHGVDEAEKNHDIIIDELRKYHAPLLDKEIFIALNKVDILKPHEIKKIEERFRRYSDKIFPISAYTGQGISYLLESLINVLPKSIY